MRGGDLKCGVLLDDLPHFLLVRGAVFLVEVVGLSLRGRLRVGVIQEVLDTQQDLLNRNRRFPRLLLVQNRKTDGSRGVDVGVEERGNEFAYMQDKWHTWLAGDHAVIFRGPDKPGT